MIDSLKLFETLKSAELPDSHARAIVQVIGSAFDDNELRQSKALAGKVDATKLDAEVHAVETSLKQDILGLRSELKRDTVELRAELKGDMLELRAEFKADMVNLRAELKEDMHALRTELMAGMAELRGEMARIESRLETRIAQSQTAMIRWMFVLWIGQMAAARLLR